MTITFWSNVRIESHQFHPDISASVKVQSSKFKSVGLEFSNFYAEYPACKMASVKIALAVQDSA